MRRDSGHPVGGPHEDHALAVGYIPLHAAAPGRVVGVDDPEALRVLAEAQRCPSGQADALMWVWDSEGRWPVFVMEQADAIADHLLTWSGGR